MIRRGIITSNQSSLHADPRYIFKGVFLKKALEACLCVNSKSIESQCLVGARAINFFSKGTSRLLACTELRFKI